MNIKQKVIIPAITIISILITNFTMLTNCVKAASLTEIPNIEIHANGYCGQLLKYKGVIVKTTFVQYSHNGNNYPAYCLDKTLIGVSDELTYSVSTNDKIHDLGLWRTIINGYPYKSVTELGVENELEAFTATKQAIYCYLFENTPGDYEAIGEAGERTLNALNMIVTNAQNSTETQEENILKIKANREEWTEDETDSNYISKTYSVISNLRHLDYEIELNSVLPEGSKIVGIDGNEKFRFTENEKFKIMLLKNSLTENGEIQLTITTEAKTKPVIYGASPNSAWQNYALTGYMYEESQTEYLDKYQRIEQPEKPEKPEEPRKPQKPAIPENDKHENEVRILPVTGM